MGAGHRYRGRMPDRRPRFRALRHVQGSGSCLGRATDTCLSRGGSELPAGILGAAAVLHHCHAGGGAGHARGRHRNSACLVAQAASYRLSLHPRGALCRWPRQPAVWPLGDRPEHDLRHEHQRRRTHWNRRAPRRGLRRHRIRGASVLAEVHRPNCRDTGARRRSVLHSDRGSHLRLRDEDLGRGRAGLQEWLGSRRLILDRSCLRT